MAALSVPVSVLAATGNGCDESSGNEYINPELALCSTHVYNIGGVTNPDNDSDREIMRDVIALKTTVMTQQMYKQYEYLESMIKRFKTQLEKAVLTTKLQAAGADTSNSSSSSFKSTDKNIRLAGAQNCVVTSYQNAHSCLTSNIQLVLNAINGGNNIGEAKKQLETDLEAATTWGIICGKSKAYGLMGDNKECNTNALNSCNKLSSRRDDIIQCAQQFNAVVSRASYDMQQKQNNQNKYMLSGI